MELEELRKLMENKKLMLRDCSMCGYTCTYQYINEKLYYDCGCYCTGRFPTLELRAESDFLWTVNTNNWDAEKIKSMLTGAE